MSQNWDLEPTDHFYRNISKMADRFYNEDEAQEILRLATRRSTTGGGMSRDRLIQAASEMGIDPAEVLAAEQEVQNRQSAVNLRKRFEYETQQKFFKNFSSLGGTCIMLYGISFLTYGWHGIFNTWAIWPCGFMALGAAGEFWEYLTSKGPMGDHKFEQWKEKQARKQRSVEWAQNHPDAPTHLHIARASFAEHGPEELEHVVEEVREKTRLRRSAARDLVNSVAAEEIWKPVTAPGPPMSKYEAARQALAEVGFEKKSEAITLLRQRTALTQQEAEETVEAVVELNH